jgi:hypothetical protein
VSLDNDPDCRHGNTWRERNKARDADDSPEGTPQVLGETLEAPDEKSDVKYADGSD